MTHATIRVLHVVLGLEVGGLERFVVNLIRQMPDWVLARVVCLQEVGALGHRETGYPIEALHLPVGFHPHAVRRLSSLIRRKRIDLVHSHNMSPHLHGALAACLQRKPLVHTKHGRNYPGNRRRVLLNRALSHLTDRIVAVSSDAAEVCTRVEGVRQDKVVTILNGVDADTYRPGPRAGILEREHGIPPDRFRIGVVARLSPEKDHETLLLACAELKMTITNFQLIVIGDGVLREGLERRSRELALAGNVTFLGMRSDIPELVRELDVFALSSVTEGLSLTLLEALASGVPAVATDVGGNAEAVPDEVAGFIVPPRNPGAFAARLARLHADARLRSRLGQAGREHVIRNFSMRETARSYVDLYDRLTRKEVATRS